MAVLPDTTQYISFGGKAETNVRQVLKCPLKHKHIMAADSK